MELCEHRKGVMWGLCNTKIPRIRNCSLEVYILAKPFVKKKSAVLRLTHSVHVFKETFSSSSILERSSKVMNDAVHHGALIALSIDESTAR